MAWEGQIQTLHWSSRINLCQMVQEWERVMGGHFRSGKECFWMGEGGTGGGSGPGDRISHSDAVHILTVITNASRLTQTAQICTSKIADADLSSPIGQSEACHVEKALLH